MSCIRRMHIILGMILLSSLGFNFLYTTVHLPRELLLPEDPLERTLALQKMRHTCRRSFVQTSTCAAPCHWCDDDNDKDTKNENQNAWNCIPEQEPCPMAKLLSSSLLNRNTQGQDADEDDDDDSNDSISRHGGSTIQIQRIQQNMNHSGGKRRQQQGRKAPVDTQKTMRLARRQSRKRQKLQQEEYDNMTDHEKSKLIVLPEDEFYRIRYQSPIVLKKYKLLFVPIPKVACTQWLQLFRRMEGQKDWVTRQIGLPYTPEFNGLTYLSDFSLTEANEIMKSPEWTRAVFVRDPKERFLSAYLDKVVNSQHIVLNTCCRTTRDCASPNTTFAEFFHMTETCHNEHWTPQSDRLPTTVWERINFVGHMDHLEQDARKLLERIGAWEEHGRTGWGHNGTQSLFAAQTGKTSAQRHATQAHKRLLQYYSPEMEDAVEHRFRQDYNNSVFQLTLRRIHGESRDAVIT